MDLEDYKLLRERSLDDFATVHSTVSSVLDLLDLFRSFNASRWAFRGQGSDRALSPSIERVTSKRGIAEDYVMREFRRRAHQYLANLPRDVDDLEWLALMQHHGAPTRLLDWTRSAHIAAFFAAQASNLSNPGIKTEVGQPLDPFVIWAVDVEMVNAEAAEMFEVDPIVWTKIRQSLDGAAG